MAFELVEEMERASMALEAGGVAYALCGGLALAIHGHPRLTQDIDVLVRAEELARAADIARGIGFDVPARKMIFGLRTGTPREVQRLSKIDATSGRLLSLDFLVVAPDLEPVWSTRIRVPWRDREIWVVSREGLATMKRIAGRPQDLVDIGILEGTSDEET